MTAVAQRDAEAKDSITENEVDHPQRDAEGEMIDARLLQIHPFFEHKARRKDEPTGRHKSAAGHHLDQHQKKAILFDACKMLPVNAAAVDMVRMAAPPRGLPNGSGFAILENIE